jgi:hypothetical protein
VLEVVLLLSSFFSTTRSTIATTITAMPTTTRVVFEFIVCSFAPGAAEPHHVDPATGVAGGWI